MLLPLHATSTAGEPDEYRHFMQQYYSGDSVRHVDALQGMVGLPADYVLQDRQRQDWRFYQSSFGVIFIGDSLSRYLQVFGEKDAVVEPVEYQAGCPLQSRTIRYRISAERVRHIQLLNVGEHFMAITDSRKYLSRAVAELYCFPWS